MEWISVKDSLPNYSDVVLVWESDTKLIYTGFRGSTSVTGEHWKSLYVDKRIYATHWMPLPEPPKQ